MESRQLFDMQIFRAILAAATTTIVILINNNVSSVQTIDI
jgi:hypothetical protein